MKVMYEHVNERNGKWSPLLADDVYEIIKEVRAAAIPPPTRRSTHPRGERRFSGKECAYFLPSFPPFFKLDDPG